MSSMFPTNNDETLPWAFDSTHNELDPELKAAQVIALEIDPSYFEAEHSEPILLRNLLSDEQMDHILDTAAGEGIWPRGIANKKKNEEDDKEGYLNEQLKVIPHHFAWTGEHVVLYMHNNDHWFVRALPRMWSIIRGAMESRPWMEGAIPTLDDEWVESGQSVVNVRTIELHHYSVGGGLLIPGHRDSGSDLTISVLMSDPAEVVGGDFVTYDRDGVPIAHKMERGDAILFNSEKLHNIATVTSGLRKSLVVELWPSKRY